VRTAEVAHLAGVNPQTLRYYERIGLLDAPPRTPGGYRNYPADTVGVLRFVHRAKELGFQLDQIGELLEFTGNGPESCETVRSVAETRVRDLDQRINDLRRMRDSLNTLVTGCKTHNHTHCCPILESLEQR
jgi:MerR family mercuric resistance operon transcriptional regulator